MPRQQKQTEYIGRVRKEQDSYEKPFGLKKTIPLMGITTLTDQAALPAENPAAARGPGRAVVGLHQAAEGVVRRRVTGTGDAAPRARARRSCDATSRKATAAAATHRTPPSECGPGAYTPNNMDSLFKNGFETMLGLDSMRVPLIACTLM